MNHNNTSKMIIVVRKDILDLTGNDKNKMDGAKLSAQISHGVLGLFLDKMRASTFEDYTPPDKDYKLCLEVKKRTPLAYWLEGSFTKVVLTAKNEYQFLKHYNLIKEAGFDVTLITDEGRTVFNGVETHTCFVVEPAFSEDIDKLTKKLRLLTFKVE